MFSETVSYFKKDPTALSLLYANLITILIALFFQWSVVEVMWVYLAQSCIIGFFNFVKMLTFSLRLNNLSLAMGLFISVFFLVHYFGFNFGYAFFLLFFSMAANINFFSLFSVGFFFVIIMFFANHLFSFLTFYKKSTNYDFSINDISKIMFHPYVRIIPMHLTIIFGGIFLITGIFPELVLVLFLLLKTGADLQMHKNEHKSELI
jgi:hypothetical protein